MRQEEARCGKRRRLEGAEEEKGKARGGKVRPWRRRQQDVARGARRCEEEEARGGKKEREEEGRAGARR